jgi:3-oxoacyl-ACP reductase-like protein
MYETKDRGGGTADDDESLPQKSHDYHYVYRIDFRIRKGSKTQALAEAAAQDFKCDVGTRLFKLLLKNYATAVEQQRQELAEAAALELRAAEIKKKVYQ